MLHLIPTLGPAEYVSSFTASGRQGRYVKKRSRWPTNEQLSPTSALRLLCDLRSGLYTLPMDGVIMPTEISERTVDGGQFLCAEA